MTEAENSEPCSAHTSVAADDSHERQHVSHGQLPRLTIIPEKIDRVMADVQRQIEGLQLDLAKLRLARARVALFQAKEREPQGQGVEAVTATVCSGAVT